MGFHIIIRKDNNHLEHRYVDSCEQLAYIPNLTKDSLIFEGEGHVQPVAAGDSDQFKNFTEDWFRAGIKAQELFHRQALEQGLMIQTLSQDQQSFKSYTIGAKLVPIKRGDFLIRNAGNLEVDVKCRSFFRINGERYFNFKKDDFFKHVNMINFTKAPIVIAVYQRSGADVQEDQLFMFGIQDMQKEVQDLETEYRSDVGSCYKIPLGLTKKGFKLIEKYMY